MHPHQRARELGLYDAYWHPKPQKHEKLSKEQQAIYAVTYSTERQRLVTAALPGEHNPRLQS